MATHDYVPVTGDDWYQRRREDAEGRFFRSVADQGPRTGQLAGSSRQGVYFLSAGGTLLAYTPGAVPADNMRATVLRGLAEWRQLPESERRPGAVQIDDVGTPDGRYARRPPPGGLILKVYTRALERPAAGASWDAARVTGDGPARDHLWLTEAEWRLLVPADVRPGDTFPAPPRVAERILRFHLVDNTRGEPRMWERDHIRASQMTLTVEKATAMRVRLRLDGAALLATHADIARADRGYDVRLLGYADYDRTHAIFDRFDVVAIGDRWSEGADGGGAGPLRGPLGIAFELARGDSAADHLPPQAARGIQEYFGGEARP